MKSLELLFNLSSSPWTNKSPDGLKNWPIGSEFGIYMKIRQPFENRCYFKVGGSGVRCGVAEPKILKIWKQLSGITPSRDSLFALNQVNALYNGVSQRYLWRNLAEGPFGPFFFFSIIEVLSFSPVHPTVSDWFSYHEKKFELLGGTSAEIYRCEP